MPVAIKNFAIDTDFSFNENQKYFNLEYLKAVAIVWVIILHLTHQETFRTFFFEFHIWQAVPIFLVVAGITGSISIGKLKNPIKDYFSFHNIKRKLSRIYFPFLIIFFIEAVLYYINDNLSFNQMIKNFIAGGIGPGAYFIPVIVQHLLIFPFIFLALKEPVQKRPLATLVLTFLFCLLIEYALLKIGVSKDLYSILYARYIFAAVLGIYFYYGKINFRNIVIPAIISGIYTYFSSSENISFGIIPPFWFFQHAPGYFYTSFLICILLYSFQIINAALFKLRAIGFASLHIYLIQKLILNKTYPIFESLSSETCYSFAMIPICLILGICFYYSENELRRLISDFARH